MMTNEAWFPRAVVNKALQSGWLNDRDVLSPSSRGWKSKIRVSAALVPSFGCEGESVPCLSPASVGLWTILDVPWLVDASP